MMLGKRSRPPMKRTTSMTEFTIDLNHVEPLSPSDPRSPTINRQKLVSPEGSASRRKPIVDVPEGFDHRFLSNNNSSNSNINNITVSPRIHRRNSADLVETPHFLRVCGLCNRRLAPGRDIYMYRGDTAFCSLECRQQQMNQDERKEKCSLASNVETTSTVQSETSTKSGTVAAA